MSAVENGQQTEQRSSVAISMTAKGDATVTVKVYAETDADELDRIRRMAVAAYRDTAAEVRT